MGGRVSKATAKRPKANVTNTFNEYLKAKEDGKLGDDGGGSVYAFA